MSVATTKLSSRGQVVIPEKIRKEMKLKPGDAFTVTRVDGKLLFEKVSPMSKEEFDELLASARREARKAGFTKKDLARIIKEVRAENR